MEAAGTGAGVYRAGSLHFHKELGSPVLILGPLVCLLFPHPPCVNGGQEHSSPSGKRQCRPRDDGSGLGLGVRDNRARGSVAAPLTDTGSAARDLQKRIRYLHLHKTSRLEKDYLI